MSCASNDELDRLGQRIELLHRDAKERPHLASMLLSLADELENELKWLRRRRGETDDS